MNYPVKEHKEQVLAKQRVDMETLAKFYIESASIAEFKVKAAAAGIQCRYMLMSFYVYYAAMNSTSNYSTALLVLISAVTSVIAITFLALTVFLLFLLGWSFFWLMFYPLFVFVIFTYVSRTFWGCFGYAERYIDLHLKYR